METDTRYLVLLITGSEKRTGMNGTKSNIWSGGEELRLQKKAVAVQLRSGSSSIKRVSQSCTVTGRSKCVESPNRDSQIQHKRSR